MSQYKILLFDLDGTLVDTSPGVLACFKYTLDRFGIPQPADCWQFLGPSLKYSFGTLCGMDEESTEEAIKVHRQKYSTEELFNGKVFDGIEDMLCTLKENGYVLAVATCKMEKFAQSLLEHFGLAKYFAFIGGSDENRHEKSEVIIRVLEKLGKKDTTGILMVGDRDNDVKGAAAVGIPCLYALWGYGSADEAEKNNALATAETPYECTRFVTGN